jgi:hypothetical protein
LPRGAVIVFVRGFFNDPTTTVDDLGNVTLQRSGSTTFETTSDNTAVLVDQQGSGDILQLQTSGTDKFLIKNNGEMNLNVSVDTETDNLVVIESNDSEVFSINARGQATFAGNIFIKDDTFAGSIATDSDGIAQITFTYHLGTGKPSVQLTPESDSPVFAQISEWTQDENQNYTGIKIKTFGFAGTSVSSIVHYLVVGKQADYQTSGTMIEVVQTPTPPPVAPAVVEEEPVIPPVEETLPPPEEIPAIEEVVAEEPEAEPATEPTPEPQL